MNKSIQKNLLMMSVFFLALVVMFSVLLHVPNLVSTLGISSYAAKRVIDIVSTAGNVAAVVGIVAAVIGGGGIGVGILYTAKRLVAKYGARYAAAG